MFNAVGLLDRSLGSIARQKLPRDAVEVVIVDDGSTDGTAHEVRRQLEELGLEALFLTRENRGVGGARNIGIAASGGDYVFFLDADDELPPDFLRHVRREVFQPEPDLVWVWKVHGPGGIPRRIRHPMTALTCGRNCLTRYLRDPLDAQVMVRRKFLESGGIRYREDVAYGEDVDLFIRLLFHAREVRVSRELFYNHHRHDGQVTRTIDQAVAKGHMARIYDALLAEFGRDGAGEEILELLRLRKAEMVIKLLMMSRERGDERAFDALMEVPDTGGLLDLTLSRGLSLKWRFRALRLLGLQPILTKVRMS